MALTGKQTLFISYNGMLEPLGQSQVIPYLKELARFGARIALLSFERAAAFNSEGRARCEKLREELAACAIEWHWLRYHQKPSVPATMFDVANGVRRARALVRRRSVELVHARSHVPGAIALALKKEFGLKMIFDVRGLMAEEYVDAGHWRQGGIPYRITKTMERHILAASDGVVTLTEKIWPIIKHWDGLRDRGVPHEIVPCCADLELFRFSDEDCRRRRTELGLQDRRVIIYSGSIGGWYLADRMADFFVALLEKNSGWHFLWLTTGPPEMINGLMSERAIKSNQYTIQKVVPEEVPSYLSASDAGIGFYKPALSRLATSPVKVTEYLACGLPVIVNAGVGDSDALVTSKGVGVVVADFTNEGYARAAAGIEALALKPDETRQRARAVAEEHFDLRLVGAERYARLYDKVLSNRN